jgi:hypothetical protein
MHRQVLGPSVEPPHDRLSPFQETLAPSLYVLCFAGTRSVRLLLLGLVNLVAGSRECLGLAIFECCRPLAHQAADSRFHHCRWNIRKF